MTTYEPTGGMQNFIRIVQAVSPVDAEELLAVAFEACAAHAVAFDFRLRIAAPALLAACELANAAAVKGELIDWTEITRAITQARGGEQTT